MTEEFKVCRMASDLLQGALEAAILDFVYYEDQWPSGVTISNNVPAEDDPYGVHSSVSRSRRWQCTRVRLTRPGVEDSEINRWFRLE